jgi:hypothetical protein
LWTLDEAKKTDVYSFGMVCFWLLFEPRLAGIKPVPPGLGISSERTRGSTRDTLSKIKSILVSSISMFLDFETTLERDHRQSLETFFKSSLDGNPRTREADITDLVNMIDPKR